MPVIPAMWGSTRRKDHSPGQPTHKTRHYLKNNQFKKGQQSGSRGRVPLSKHETQNSATSTIKKIQLQNKEKLIRLKEE
jgi:hypothetical protein